MNIVVVYNGNSGSALPESQLKSLFTDNGHTVDIMIDITRSADSIVSYAKPGVTIAVVGGDGTISSVANSILGTSAILAPLPGGTLNHFTNDLGVPQDLKQAISALRSNKPRKIDVATVNGTVFVNNSSIGLYPSSIHEREQLQPKFGKWPAAIIASAKAFVRFRRYGVSINGKEYRTPFVFVGNNNYDIDNGAKRSSLTNGTLCVHIIASSSRLSLLKILGYAIAGSIRESDDLLSFTASSVTIHTKKHRLKVSRDGEVAHESTPLQYECRPASLTVLA